MIKSEYSQNIDSVRAQVIGDHLKVKRFPNGNNRENETPGPGYYFPSILNTTIINNKKIKMIIIL